MVAPVGEFANIHNFPPHTQPADFSSTPNPNTNAPPNTNLRGHPLTNNGSNNLPRHPSTESNITTSSLDYAERMETQPTSTSWADQTSMEEDISPPPPNQLQGQINETVVNPSQILLRL